MTVGNFYIGPQHGLGIGDNGITSCNTGQRQLYYIYTRISLGFILNNYSSATFNAMYHAWDTGPSWKIAS